MLLLDDLSPNFCRTAILWNLHWFIRAFSLTVRTVFFRSDFCLSSDLPIGSVERIPSLLSIRSLLYPGEYLANLLRITNPLQFFCITIAALIICSRVGLCTPFSLETGPPDTNLANMSGRVISPASRVYRRKLCSCREDAMTNDFDSF